MPLACEFTSELRETRRRESQVPHRETCLSKCSAVFAFQNLCCLISAGLLNSRRNFGIVRFQSAQGLSINAFSTTDGDDYDN